MVNVCAFLWIIEFYSLKSNVCILDKRCADSVCRADDFCIKKGIILEAALSPNYPWFFP
jgi:hypothetical protein